MKANFLFDRESKYTIQDAYVLGNLFSYNYIETIDRYKGKRASFVSIKSKPQSSNSSGFEYTRESFEAYKDSLLTFLKEDPKWDNVKIQILWDEDTEHDGVFRKTRGRRALFFNLDFDTMIDYIEILSIVRSKITELKLLIWFFRGIIDSRGSMDNTAKRIAVDMDKTKSYDQAKEIEILSSKYFKDITKFTNFNPRVHQPSDASKSKNSQMRPNIDYYLSKIGTINPQLIMYYEFFNEDTSNIVLSDKNEFFIVQDEKNYPEQENKLDKLRLNDIYRKGKSIYNLPHDVYKNKRRYLSTDDKLETWKSLNNASIDGEIEEFVLAEWHHVIPNALRENKDFEQYQTFIDLKQNFVPLSSNAHSLIHKKDDKLSQDSLKKKYEIIEKLHEHIKKHIDIRPDVFMEIYR